MVCLQISGMTLGVAGVVGAVLDAVLAVLEATGLRGPVTVLPPRRAELALAAIRLLLVWIAALLAVPLLVIALLAVTLLLTVALLTVTLLIVAGILLLVGRRVALATGLRGRIA